MDRTSTRRHRPRRHRLHLLAVSVAGVLLLAVPAVAQPAIEQLAAGGGGGDADPPLPGLLVTGAPRCDPAGIDYQLTIVDGLEDRPYMKDLHWVNVDTAQAGVVDPSGPSDSITTGEGSVHLTATLTYPGFAGEGVPGVPEVVVDNEILIDVSCAGPGEDPDGDPDDDPDPDGDPNGGDGNPGDGNPGDGDPGNGGPGDDGPGGADPDVRSATPTFTG